MDHLKELNFRLGGKIRDQNLSNWNYGRTSFRELVLKDYKGYKVAVSDFTDMFELSVKVESDFFFSINLPNKLWGHNKPSSVKNIPYKIYFPDGKYRPQANGDTDFQGFWHPFIDKIKTLELNKNEGVFFYQNVIELFLNAERNLIPILDDLIHLINSNHSLFESRQKEKIFKKNIPQDLRFLVPFLKKWSISDDNEREQLMEETSEKQKKKLVKTVWPYLVQINDFLDSFGDEPLSHEAILFGNLAELVSELQIDNA